MIDIRGVTKTYGRKTAVHDVSFTVQPGTVTGFLGPNGAGKSTTMRMILGLDRPDRGTLTINGQDYATMRTPMRQVGALLDESGLHPHRSLYSHLRALAATNGIPRTRVDEVIGMVGLEAVAGKRAKAMSLGMRQRAGLAAALLGEPEVLLLDEPVNGLDPDGIRWIRHLLRDLAAHGRTVLISSHLMSEMALTADHLIVLGRGRVLADLPLSAMTASAIPRVLVRSNGSEHLRGLLSGPGIVITTEEGGRLLVQGHSTGHIAKVAHAHDVLIDELTPVEASLEDAYLALTQRDLEYAIGPTGRRPGRRPA